MRNYLVTLILFTLTSNYRTQTPPWHWAKHATSGGDEMAWDVACDNSSGHVYVVGLFNGNLSSVYGSSFASTNGGIDGFVSKYDQSGNLVWAFKIGGSANDEVKSVAVDPSGNIYITGNFKSTTDFDPSIGIFNLTPLSGSGNNECFLAKYNSSGNFQWAVKFGSSDEENIWNMSADNNGVYLGGEYKSSINFNSTNAVVKTATVNTGDHEFFGAKYSTAGVAQWVIAGISDKYDRTYDVVADNAGVYFTGSYNEDMDVYDASGNPVDQLLGQSGDNPNVFVIAVNHSGMLNWCTNVVSSDDDYGYGIGQDINGLYITGSIKATANFRHPSPQFTKSVVGGRDIFLAKIDKSTGNFLWVSSQTGSNGGDEEGYSVAVDANNNVLVSGYFKNTLNFTPFSGPSLSASNEDIFITAFNTSGNYQWIKVPAGSGKDIPHGMAVNTTGVVYVAGEYAGPLSFSTTTLPSGGSRNVFVFKTGCEITTNNVVSSSQTICAGENPLTLNGSVPSGGNIYSWQMSANSFTWTNAPGANSDQNYVPPALFTTTYFKRDVSSGGGCLNISSSAILTITVDQAPSVSSAGNDQTVCASTATLSGNIPSVGTGTWSVITGTSTVASINTGTSGVSGLSPGSNIFEWTISNGVCPASTSTISITRHLPPTAFAGSDQTLCAASVNLNATNPSIGNGSWSVLTGTGSISTPGNPSSLVTGLSGGSNSFVWTVVNGVCPAASSTVTISRDLLPDISNAGNDFTVCAPVCTLSANTPSIGAGTWLVLIGTGNVSSAINGSTSVSNLSTGFNQFVWIISNGVCPPSSSSVSVFAETPLPPAAAGPDQVLCAENCSLNANNVSGYGTWIIVSGGGYCSDVNDPQANITELHPGMNTFVWCVSKPHCPATSDTLIVKRDEEPTLAFAGSDQLICGPNGTLSGNVPLIGNGQWQIISGNGVCTNASLPQTSVSNLSEGANEMTWIISNGVCPSSIDTLKIISDAEPLFANAGADIEICSDQTVRTVAVPRVGYGSWTVLSGNCYIVNQANSVNISVPEPGVHFLKYSVKNGICPDKSDTLKITRFELPSVANAGEDRNTEIAEIKLNAAIPSVGTGSWTVIEGRAEFADAFDPNTLVKNFSFGHTILRWTVSNGNCPVSTDDILVYLEPLAVPNGFSPNSDGLNDRFEITSLGNFSNVRFTVFNRWGSLIYKSEDYKNDWNGTNMANEKVVDDTYYYVLEIPEYQTFTGFIVLRQH